MSSASRRAALALLLSLSLFSSPLTESRAAASIPSPPQSPDHEIVRALTEKYGLSIAAGELEAMRQLWLPSSPHLGPRLRVYQGLLSYTRIEFINQRVTRLEVAGEKAVSHLTTDERHLEKKTGSLLSERDAFHGACRAFEWVKTNDGWRIEREFSAQDDLAVRLDGAASEQEREELLEKEKVLVTDALVTAMARRADSHRMRGDFARALRCHQLERMLAERIGDNVGHAKSWVNIGFVTYMLGDPEQALPCLQKALSLYEAAGAQRGPALALEVLTRIHLDLGDHPQAFECALKAVRLSREERNPIRIATALTVLALVYQHQRNFKQALAGLESSLAIFQEMNDKIRIAITRHDLAFQHYALGQFEQALEIYLELLHQTEGSADRSGKAMIQTHLAHIFTAQGKYAEALDFFRHALPEFEARNDKRSTVAVLAGITGIYRRQRKYSEALPGALQAVSLSRQIGQPFLTWLALSDLGHCQLALNRTLEARDSFAEAVSIIERLRAQTVGGPRDLQRYFEQRLGAHHGMVTLCVIEKKVHEALVFAERAKARTLLDLMQQGRVHIEKAMTAQEQEQEKRLKGELTRLNTQLVRARQSDKPDAERISSELKSQLEKARLNYEAFQNLLYAAHPELILQRGEASIIKVEELAALLPDSASALLEYVVTDYNVHLFAITKAVGKAKADVQVYTLPISRGELAEKIEAFRRQLAGRDLGFRSSAVNLYNLLIKPAEAQLRGKTNLVIAPDDSLWDLPFQALLTGPNRFLIEDAAIAYAPSLSVLREMIMRPKNQGRDAASATLLALGNPLIGKQTVNRASLTLRDEKFDPLPEAEQEVKALSRLYGISRSKVYVGAEAREDRVKSEADQAKVLHFAAHGTINNASPMYSHLALAEGGANEDGLLEAWELMRLDLKADLAVLSACETARGHIGAGEGMIGLSWAMFIAGVPSIVVSQWKVESAGTRDLMVNFHRILITEQATRKKQRKAEALRQAAMKLMKNEGTRHPFYWAGFVLVGDGR